MHYQELFNLVTNSKKILLTSHFSPDPDAVSSLLFVYNVLQQNLPTVEVCAVIEDPISPNFTFLKNSSNIKTQTLNMSLNEFQPDLLIMLDGNNLKRFCRTEADTIKIEKLLHENAIKTVIIDHHLESGKDTSTIFINNKSSSTAEEVYTIFAKDFLWKADISDLEAVLFGIIGDTGRLLYKNYSYRRTFNVVADILDAGLSIEAIQQKMDSIAVGHTLIISELLRNLKQKDTYNYSYLTDDFVEQLISNGVDANTYLAAHHQFVNQYIRIITPNQWGFVVVPDYVSTGSEYKGSFRAIEGLLDTTVFAKLLNGGGNKAASGFKINAATYMDAIEIIEKVILDNIDSAKEM